jgi:protocatechuate 3,4-dioxygenase, beta subunit
MAQRKGEYYVATPLINLRRTLSDTTAPAYGRGAVGELDDHLTRQHSGEPVGEGIFVMGRVLDGDSRPVRNSLVEIWQANAAERYTHQHPAPLVGYRFDIVLEGREAIPMENHR